MAEKGKAKTRARRGVGDDDRHLHTDIRKSGVASPMHMAYDKRFTDQARALREPYRSDVIGNRELIS